MKNSTQESCSTKTSEWNLKLITTKNKRTRLTVACNFTQDAKNIPEFASDIPWPKCTENVIWPYLDLANWHPIYKHKPVPTSINKLSWPKSSQVQKSSSSSSPYKGTQVPKACRNSCCYDIAPVQILNTDHKKMWQARIHVSILCWQEWSDDSNLGGRCPKFELHIVHMHKWGINCHQI